jgi:hypothetical protein
MTQDQVMEMQCGLGIKDDVKGIYEEGELGNLRNPGLWFVSAVT